jgi:hypothetical protein
VAQASFHRVATCLLWRRLRLMHLVSPTELVGLAKGNYCWTPQHYHCHSLLGQAAAKCCVIYLFLDVCRWCHIVQWAACQYF